MKTDRELIQQALKMIRSLRYRSLTDVSDEIISALEERLAQPEQEPVADDIASILACRDMLDAQVVPPRTWVGSGDLEDSNAYLTPPQRKPLTDEEISDLWCKVSNTDFVTADTHVFARAIEAAHNIGEKPDAP